MNTADDEANNDEETVGSTAETKAETKTTTRMAFGSCHKSKKSSMPPIWETILPPTKTEGPSLDAWLWLGDAMYPSHRDLVTGKKYYGPAPPSEVRNGLDAMKYENATIGYKGFLERLEANANANANADDDENHRRSMVTGVWDDHDFGGNDMGVGMPSKQERKQIYQSFLGHAPTTTGNPRRPWVGHHRHHNRNREPPTESTSNKSTNDGMYHRVDLEGGKIRILVLDTRWFREDHCIPSVAHKIPLGNGVACLTRWLTSGLLLHKYAWLWGQDGCENAKVLGEEQWEWLENELLVESVFSSSASSATATEEPPELFLILSSIQVWSTNPLMEGWGHFPKEQERLWNLLRKHYSSGSNQDEDGDGDGSIVLPPAPVLFLSGDVHHAEISGQPGYYEVTSSGLTHHCAQHKLYGPVCEPILRTFSGHRESGEEKEENNHNGYYIGINYGELEILEEDGNADSARSVRATIRNATGHSVLEVVQPLAGHGPVPVLPPYNQRPHTMDGHLIPYVQNIALWAVIGLASVLFLRLR